jgi:hypothetical protein
MDKHVDAAEGGRHRRPVSAGDPATVPQPAKVLFLHTPKAGGSNLIEYFPSRLGYRRLHSTRTNEQGVWLDFRPDDLPAFVDRPDGFLSTHTLSFGWTQMVAAIPPSPKAEIVQLLGRFRETGWFSFSFVRHPGELLCSFYHYILDHHRRGNDAAVALHVPAVGVPLEEFVATHCELPLLPDYWRQLNFCGVMSDAALSDFFRAYFAHDYVPVPEWRHASGSCGYEYYCTTGQISRAAQQKVERSASMAVYREIARSQASGPTTA